MAESSVTESSVARSVVAGSVVARSIVPTSAGGSLRTLYGDALKSQLPLRNFPEFSSEVHRDMALNAFCAVTFEAIGLD